MSPRLRVLPERFFFKFHGLIFFIGVLFSSLLFGSCGERLPEISSINPQIGMTGDVLTIRGKYFGEERKEAYVTIAGVPPTNSSYLEWGDGEIQIKIPEFGDSGLVRVHRENSRSNAMLFSNRATMPALVQGEDLGAGPRIVSVSPQAGPIGGLVTISGGGFGSFRDQSAVLFSWNAEPVPAAPVEERNQEMVEVSDTEPGYEFWSEREIRVRVPDGAVDGNIEVRTPRGTSRPFYFEVSGKPGTKIFRDKRIYTVAYPVDIRTRNVREPNTLYLWTPNPVLSAAQRKSETLSRSPEPFVENYRGTALFKLNNLASGSTVSVTQSWLVEVYAQETSIRVQSVKESGSRMAAYTAPSPLLPADDPRVTALATSIVGRERNPYTKARRIYEWLLREANIGPGPLSGGVIEALERKQADPYTAALLFCALARAAGIPALPSAGVLIDRDRQTSRHYWAEFWIEDFGWVPLDPALGAGAAPGGFHLREDHQTWYFGNMDSSRITFSRGQTTLSQMDPRGRTAVRNRDFALQNLWEEAVGGLEAYSSLWGDITITGVYAQ
ncbi:MAG: IPT/TIG domain-containing protein [Treponema sp.]|jgi:transglutaminase-like putative cysteine protease|nr:IPT/TIG domain-containing protein [Treponema sp.]